MEDKIIIQNTICRHIEYHPRIRATLPFFLSPVSPFPVSARPDENDTTLAHFNDFVFWLPTWLAVGAASLPAAPHSLPPSLPLSLSLPLCVCDVGVAAFQCHAGI